MKFTDDRFFPIKLKGVFFFFFIDQDAVVVHLVNHTLFSDLLVRLELLVFLQFAMVLWLLWFWQYNITRLYLELSIILSCSHWLVLLCLDWPKVLDTALRGGARLTSSQVNLNYGHLPRRDGGQVFKVLRCFPLINLTRHPG